MMDIGNPFGELSDTQKTMLLIYRIIIRTWLAAALSYYHLTGELMSPIPEISRFIAWVMELYVVQLLLALCGNENAIAVLEHRGHENLELEEELLEEELMEEQEQD